MKKEELISYFDEHLKKTKTEYEHSWKCPVTGVRYKLHGDYMMVDVFDNHWFSPYS